MQIVKDVKELQPLAGGNMGSGGGRKKPPTTPNDRDNSMGDWREPQRWDSTSNHQRFEQDQKQTKMWNEINNPHRYMSPRQDHFNKGHTESKAQSYYDQLGGY